MSRIGKKPVDVPNGVTVTIDGQTVKAKGPKGELQTQLVDLVDVKLEDNQVTVSPVDQSKPARSAWGMSRTLIANLITGVTDGFTRKLEINGVGYRAAVQRPGCRRDPRMASAGAVQGQGHQVCRRNHLPQGRQEEVTRESRSAS